MPTNILRKASDTRPPARPRAAAGARTAVLSVGRVSLRLQLMATDTADRVWAALPIHSTAETWGACIHFETPVETGRDRTAKLNEIGAGTQEIRKLIIARELIGG